MGIKFSYDDSTKTLKVDEDGVKKVYRLSDNRSQIFRLILQAIDGLDNNEFQEVASWAIADDTSVIPDSKLPKELPDLPELDGTYKLIVTVAAGEDPVYEWVTNA